MILISAGIKAYGSYQAGKAARMEGRLTARNIKSQAKYRQLQGIQEHNQIMEQLTTFKNTNLSLAGSMGRDQGSDRSLKALRNKANKNNATTIARANVQLGADLSKYSQQAQMAELKGKNLQRAYRYKMFSSMASGAYQYSLV